MPFAIYDEGETLPKARPPARGGRPEVGPRFRVPLHPQQRAVHPRGDPRGRPPRRPVVQAVHDVQEAAEADGSDEFIAKAMDRIAPLGGLCQLHCENGDVLCYLEDKSIAGAGRHPRTSRRRARTGRRRRRSTARSTSAGSRAVPSTSCISAPGSAWSASCARRSWARACGRRRALSTCCSPIPRWSVGPSPRSARRCGPPRSGPRRPLGGQRAGAIASVASDHSPRAPKFKEPGLEEHLRRRPGQADPVRRAVARDARASHVQ